MASVRCCLDYLIISLIQADFDQGTSGAQKLTLFSTNDYLGLSSHPDVKQAISAAALQYGNGPRASSIVSGHTSLHEDLELRLSILKHSQACTLFPTGALANWLHVGRHVRGLPSGMARVTLEESM
jgi:7-keto-8-aminopelargonate synthetase-like enzyme